MGRKMMFLRPLKYPQVVAVDVEPGSDTVPKSFARLVPKEKQNFNENEDLKYDMIRPIDPGPFIVDIVGEDGKIVAEAPLHAAMGESYVLMRIGEKKLVLSDGRAPGSSRSSAVRRLALLGPAAALASLL